MHHLHSKVNKPKPKKTALLLTVSEVFSLFVERSFGGILTITFRIVERIVSVLCFFICQSQCIYSIGLHAANQRAVVRFNFILCAPKLSAHLLFNSGFGFFIFQLCFFHFLLLFCFVLFEFLSSFTPFYQSISIYMRNSYVLLAEILLLRWWCCCCVSWSVFHCKVSYIFFNRPWQWHWHRHYSWHSWSKMRWRMRKKREKNLFYFVASQPVKMKCSPNQKIKFFFCDAWLWEERSFHSPRTLSVCVCACVRFFSLLFARWLIQLCRAAVSVIF